MHRILMCLVLVVAMVACIGIPPLKAAEEYKIIPEFVLTKDSKKVCETSLALPEVSSDLARSRLFALMDAGDKFTEGWKRHFAIVGVDYITSLSMHVVAQCKTTSDAIGFISKFLTSWNEQNCPKTCESRGLKIAQDKYMAFTIPYQDFQFKSKVDEFLHYRTMAALKSCLIEVRPLSSSKSTLPVLLHAQSRYRFPIMDVSQIDDSIYILLSRQCRMKQELYRAVLEGITKQAGDTRDWVRVNFEPNITSYVYSQTGKQ